MGPKTLPTIWYTYMMLVTKYQISAINSYWEKCDRKISWTDGRTDRRTEVKQYTPLPEGSGGINIADLSLIVIEKQTCSWKCDTSHWTMKMRSRSSDFWQTDMYTLQCIYWTNIDDLSLTVIEKHICSWKCDANLTKSLNHNKNCSRQPCLLAKRNETKTLYRGPYIDASCQVWLHLAKQFQRRRFF
jgi:hypothetical protein